MLRQEVARAIEPMCLVCHGAGLYRAVEVDLESVYYSQSGDGHSFQEVEDVRDGLEDRGSHCMVKAEEDGCKLTVALELVSRDMYAEEAAKGLQVAARVLVAVVDFHRSARVFAV